MRNLTRVLRYLLATSLACVATVAAMSLPVGPRSEILSDAEVRASLASAQAARASSAPATPAVTGSFQPSGTAATRSAAGPTNPPRLRLHGTFAGLLAAGCDRGRAAIVNWVPARGYRAAPVESGRAAEATLRFTSDQYASVEVVARCGRGDVLVFRSTIGSGRRPPAGNQPLSVPAGRLATR